MVFFRSPYSCPKPAGTKTPVIPAVAQQNTSVRKCSAKFGVRCIEQQIIGFSGNDLKTASCKAGRQPVTLFPYNPSKTLHIFFFLQRRQSRSLRCR